MAALLNILLIYLHLSSWYFSSFRFLTEIDGFNQNRNSKIVVIAATNRLSAVDSALLRAGRLTIPIIEIE